MMMMMVIIIIIIIIIIIWRGFEEYAQESKISKLESSVSNTP
jgi:cell division protein FtsL